MPSSIPKIPALCSCAAVAIRQPKNIVMMLLRNISDLKTVLAIMHLFYDYVVSIQMRM